MNSTGQLTVYRECTPIVDARYVPDIDASPTEAIIEALAEATGVDPLEFPPLYEYVDPDAVNSLFDRQGKSRAAATVIGFQVDTWNVFVRADGRIRVCDATQPTDP